MLGGSGKSVGEEEEEEEEDDNGDCDREGRGRGEEAEDEESRVLGDIAVVVESCSEDDVVAMSDMVDLGENVENPLELAVPSASEVVYMSSFVPLTPKQSTL